MSHCKYYRVKIQRGERVRVSFLLSRSLVENIRVLSGRVDSSPRVDKH